MIVEKIGYLKLKDVLELKRKGDLFSVYVTHKKTIILILDTETNGEAIYYPKRDRLPWKVVEGKSIVSCKKLYSSNDDVEITTEGWNNNEQIMAYERAGFDYYS